MDVCTLIKKKCVCSDRLFILDAENFYQCRHLCTKLLIQGKFYAKVSGFLLTCHIRWSHQTANFWDLWSPGGFPSLLLHPHCTCIIPAYSTVVLFSGSQMSYITGEKERGTAATWQCSHKANMQCIYSMFGLLNQFTAAPRWTVHHDWFDWYDKNECRYICWMSAQ